MAIDLHDRSDAWSETALEWADLYLKRSLFVHDLSDLATDTRVKVEAFGLNYACRGPGVNQFLISSLARSYVSDACVRRTGEKVKLSDMARDVRILMAVPRTTQFERSARSARTIIFQTRVWEPNDTGPDNAAEINEERVSVVRALRRAFGDRFVGGLVPTRYAIEHYADAITHHSTKRQDYSALARQSIIGVYTRGLHHSTAFKLPEYLAAGLAIVASGMRNELPCRLMPGQHYLPFETPGECVAACQELLGSAAILTRMREANERYYRDEVEPASHLRKCVNRALVSMSDAT